MVDPSYKDRLDLVVRQQASVVSFPSFVVGWAPVVVVPDQAVPCKDPVVAAWDIVVAYHIVGTSAVGLDTWHLAELAVQGSQLSSVGNSVVLVSVLDCNLGIVLHQGLAGVFVVVVAWLDLVPYVVAEVVDVELVHAVVVVLGPVGDIGAVVVVAEALSLAVEHLAAEYEEFLVLVLVVVAMNHVDCSLAVVGVDLASFVADDASFVVGEHTFEVSFVDLA